MKIIIIEDDIFLRTEMKKILENNNYHTFIIEDLNDLDSIVGQIIKLNGDLLLLDINLPHSNGFIISKILRKHTTIPIIMLTVLSKDIDELSGLYSGADDYITKPFNTHVLLARIDRLIKRNNINDYKDFIEHVNVKLHIMKGFLEYNDQRIDLTKNEIIIMAKLMKNPEIIVSRLDLIKELWDEEYYVEDATLSVNVNRLRKKLDDIGLKDYIKTKHGMGYKL